MTFLANTTQPVPNAFIISWDMAGSSKLVAEHYPSLRDFLVDAKECFINLLGQPAKNYHDTGDGQESIIWLPETVDRSNIQLVKSFGETAILPLLYSAKEQLEAIATTKYSDIAPQLRFAIGFGHVETNRLGGLSSSESWEIDHVMNVEPRLPVNYTKAASNVLGILGQTKTPQ